ncbi:MAG: CopG family transcriptional regulator [Solirubrobacterales bacterium]
MKRLQISLEAELDQELERVAAAEGVSKAEIVRRCLRKRVGNSTSADPFVALVGAFSGPGGNAAEEHDEIIYR